MIRLRQPRAPFGQLLLTVALALPGVAMASKKKSCVERLNYSPALAAPAFEKWASEDTVSSNVAQSLQWSEPTIENECYMTEFLVHAFKQSQRLIADTTPDKRPVRGTHAKGICVNGAFEAQLDPALTGAQKSLLETSPLFTSQGELPTQFRFANGKSDISPDWVKDVRAVSMKIRLPNGSRQDFAFNNTPRFQIDSLANFVRVMQMALAVREGRFVPTGNKAKDGAQLFLLFKRIHEDAGDGIFSAPKAALDVAALVRTLLVADADQKSHTSYTDQTYWSATPFALNAPVTKKKPDQIVKFGALPCSPKSNGELASEAEAKAFAEKMQADGTISRAENYLSELLKSEVAHAPVCYKLFVQFLSEVDKYKLTGDPVENASVIWNAPVHIVGQLTIKNELVDDATCDQPSNFVSVKQHETGLTPIGQINRARDFVETASWLNR